MTLASSNRGLGQHGAREKYGFDSMLLVGEYVRGDWRKCAYRNEIAGNRWRRWTASLGAADAIFHEMPDDEEAEYCEALDWYKWDYVTKVFGRVEREPPQSANRLIFERLGKAHVFAVLEAAHALNQRWLRGGGGHGAPWRVIANARNNARACDHIDFYRVRAGKNIFDASADFDPRRMDARRRARRALGGRL